MNNRALIEERFGVTIAQGMLHSPHPHRRSYIEELTERHSEEIARTRSSRFRSGTDLSLVSSLAQHSGHLDGMYVHWGSVSHSCRSVRRQHDFRPTRVRPGARDHLTLGESGRIQTPSTPWN